MRWSIVIRGSVTPSLATMGHTTMPQRQRSPTVGLANFYINNCGDLRSLQLFRAIEAIAFGQDGVFVELKSAVEKGLSKGGLLLFVRAKARWHRLEIEPELIHCGQQRPRGSQDRPKPEKNYGWLSRACRLLDRYPRRP